MTPRSIALIVLAVFWTAVGIMLWRTFVSPRLRRRVKVIEPPTPEPAVKLPPPWQALSPRHPIILDMRTVPTIPTQLTDPYVFTDARLGIVMVANYPVVRGAPGEPWLFRVHGDHWCSVRAAGFHDLETVAKLKTYQPSIA